MLRFGYVGASLDHVQMPSQLDIAPTIVKELGLEVPISWSGLTLQTTSPREFVYFQQGADVGLIDLRDPARHWKYWRRGGVGMEQVYDLSNDPGETKNEVLRVPQENRSLWRQKLAPAIQAVEALRMN
jgi:arylsulfatase A-like enzyme